MKRILLVLISVVTSLSAVAQEISDMVFVHRNDGDFNIFVRSEIDSITYSNFDADSVFHEQLVSQVVYTLDSTYIIPLAVVDSVSFVRPETVYEDDVKEIKDDFLSYVVSVDSLTLTLRSDIPNELCPKIGDKLAHLQYAKELPNGFLGKVVAISNSPEGIVLTCEGVPLDEAVKRFYGVFINAFQANPYEMLSDAAEAEQVKKLIKKTPIEVYTVSPQAKLVRVKNLPVNIDLAEYELFRDQFADESVVEGGITLSPKAELNATISPAEMMIRLTTVKDDFLNLPLCLKIKVDAGLFVKGDFDLVGKLSSEVKLPSPIVPETEIFPGISIFLKPGIKFEGSGEFGAGWDFSGIGKFSSEFVIFPQVVPLPSQPVPAFNVIPLLKSAEWLQDQFKWKYLLGRANIYAGVFLEAGLGLVTHKIANVSAELGLGVDLNAEIKIDEDSWRTAEQDTRFYDISKDNMKVECSPVASIGAGVGFLDDRLKFQATLPLKLPGPHYESNLLPTFEEVNMQPTKKSVFSAETVPYFDKGFLDFKIGVTMHDETGYYNQTEMYDSEEDYWNAEKLTFDNLMPGTVYNVNPTFEFFGKKVLASPTSEYLVPEPVMISNFRMTNSRYYSYGFEFEGSTYEYRYETQMVVTLQDSENVEDWGYVYEDPHGKKTHISLKEFASPYLETRYAYFRNSARSSVRFYGYVKYVDSDEIFYCMSQDHLLEYEEWDLCPDDNHPHMIDLGLPSGTKWSCCNVGASSPCASGQYFAWGETSMKYWYEIYNYQYYRPDDAYNYVYLGDDIAGTEYDAARANMGAPWQMPSYDQYLELSKNCSVLWVTHHGVRGIEVRSENGQAIFLPAVCRLASMAPWTGIGDIAYWSSSRGTPSEHIVDGKTIYSDTRAQGILMNNQNWFNFLTAPRQNGLSVRAVCK